MNYKTLYGKISRETLKVSEILLIAGIVGIDLSDMQDKCYEYLPTASGGKISNIRGMGKEKVFSN